VLDLKVEIASFAREMSTSIQQYQMVELGSPQSSRHLETVGRINANAVTPEDTSARVAGRLVGIDEEKLLIIENRATTKWWWLVHPKLPKRKGIYGKLGGILLPGGREVKRNGKAVVVQFEVNRQPKWRENGARWLVIRCTSARLLLFHAATLQSLGFPPCPPWPRFEPFA
jgi:hypothetical protein